MVWLEGGCHVTSCLPLLFTEREEEEPPTHVLFFQKRAPMKSKLQLAVLADAQILLPILFTLQGMPPPNTRLHREYHDEFRVLSRSWNFLAGSLVLFLSV
jgi:hypothetical protein